MLYKRRMVIFLYASPLSNLIMQAPHVVPGELNPPNGPPSFTQHRRLWNWIHDPKNAHKAPRLLNVFHALQAVNSQTTTAPSQSHGYTAAYHLASSSTFNGNDHTLPSNADHAPTFTLPSLVPPNIVNVPQAFNFHHQVPDLYLTNSDTAQYSRLDNMSRNRYPMNILHAPRPVPADIDVLLARENAFDADWHPWARSPPSFDPIPLDSNEQALRATRPVQFLCFTIMEMVSKDNIIQLMIHQRLVDLNDKPEPYFTSPDTRQYAQFSTTSSDSTEVVTRQYYSKIPRNPCFPNDLRRPIYPIKLLKRLSKHLERYHTAFPQPLPVVVIRQSDIVATIPEVVRQMHGAICYVVPVSENRSNPEEPEDSLWSMVLKRGISSSNRPYIPATAGREILAFSVKRGNVVYEPIELNFFNYAVNVFVELPMLTLKEPRARYEGAFILKDVDCLPLVQERWDELSENRKMDIYDHAPHLFEGYPPFLKSPAFPAISLHFQNWDMTMLGVLDELESEAVTAGSDGN